MQGELRELQQRLKITTVHVTHDQEEAMTMSDRLIIMNNGSIEQEGSPLDIYRRPRSSFVAHFMGRCNQLQGRVKHWNSEKNSIGIDLNVGGSLLVPWHEKSSPPEEVIIYIRPEHVSISNSDAISEKNNVLKGSVRRSVYLGSLAEIHVDLPGNKEILVEMQNPPDDPELYPIGTEVYLHLHPNAINLLPTQ
jgi:ABC-type Fe3+/spermidine/putrescine transport system ATPase subunit